MDKISLVSFYFREISLLCSLLFFFATAKRKRNFPLRFIFSLFSYFAVVTGLYYLNGLFFKSDMIGFLSSTTLFYFADYICLLVLPLFVFDMGYSDFFARSVANQAVNMLVDIFLQILYNPIFSFAEMLFPANADFAYRGIKFFLTILLFFLLFFLTLKRWTPGEDTLLKDGKTTFICYSSLLFILYWLNILASYINIALEGGLAYTGYIVLFFVCVFVLLLLYCVQSINRQKEETQIIEQLMHEREQQYNLAKENVDIINQKCHDLKHQIRALKVVSEEERASYIQELEDSIMLYGSVAITGNETVDTILSEKTLYCERKGIKLTAIIDAKPLEMIRTVDLYTLFGNAIDNAVEAVEQCEDPSHRIISIHISATAALLAIQIRNYCKDIPAVSESFPPTKKEDKINHGYGLKSIQSIAKKYGGDMCITHENEIFTLFVGIPLP